LWSKYLTLSYLSKRSSQEISSFNSPNCKRQHLSIISIEYTLFSVRGNQNLSIPPIDPHEIYFKKSPEKAQESSPQERFSLLSMYPDKTLNFGTDFAVYSRLKRQKPVKKQKP